MSLHYTVFQNIILSIIKCELYLRMLNIWKARFSVFILIILISVNSIESVAQNKVVNNDSQTWLQYFLNARFHKLWSIHFDAGYRRREDFVNKPLIWLSRVGLTLHAGKKVTVTGGYALFSNYVETTSTNFYRTEHRPYLRFNLAHKLSKLHITHRYRIESRNFQKTNKQGTINGYTSLIRQGYQLNFQYPLIGKSFGKGIPYVIAYDEIFLNFGASASSTFDQNRLYFGFGYVVCDKLSVTLGYQYIYQQRNKNTFENTNSVRLNILHNIDFRNAEEITPTK